MLIKLINYLYNSQSTYLYDEDEDDDDDILNK
jgi:hypothetical protein